MSGPITAGYFLVQGLLMLSARAIREAQAMKCEFGAVRDQLLQREAELADGRRRQQDARLERVIALRRHADRQAARLARLNAVAASLASHDGATLVGARQAPAAPGDHDDASWSAYVQDLDAAVREAEALLAQSGGRLGERVRSLTAATTEVPDIDDVLSAYMLQRQMQPGLDAGQAERFRATAARILARLELEEGATLPADLEAIARQIVLAPSIEHAEALATELRRAVQHEREQRIAQQKDGDRAAALLHELPQDAPAPLLCALEAVAAGVQRLDATLAAAAADALALAREHGERLEQEAAALVLEASLRDLGYEVDGIEATLFATGGTVHFRRPGWDNYFVRLRVDADERNVNFNVVRASGDEPSTERQRLDALAEDRWCAEFPRLLDTLAARGLRLDVTRRLEAGELPVQVVDTAQLPHVPADDDEARRPRGAPRGRALP